MQIIHRQLERATTRGAQECPVWQCLDMFFSHRVGEPGAGEDDLGARRRLTEGRHLVPVVQCTQRLDGVDLGYDHPGPERSGIASDAHTDPAVPDDDDVAAASLAP